MWDMNILYEDYLNVGMPFAQAEKMGRCDENYIRIGDDVRYGTFDSNDKQGILARREDLSLVTKEDVTDEQIIDAAVHLQQGQTRYQNNTFVVGSQITPYKKSSTALLELETRQHGFTEPQYKQRLCTNNRKKIERSLKLEQEREIPDELEIERLEIEPE